MSPSPSLESAFVVTSTEREGKESDETLKRIPRLSIYFYTGQEDNVFDASPKPRTSYEPLSEKNGTGDNDQSKARPNPPFGILQVPEDFDDVHRLRLARPPLQNDRHRHAAPRVLGHPDGAALGVVGGALAADVDANVILRNVRHVNTVSVSVRGSAPFGCCWRAVGGD